MPSGIIYCKNSYGPLKNPLKLNPLMQKEGVEKEKMT